MKEIIIEVPDRFGKWLIPEKVNCEIKGELVRCKHCKNVVVYDDNEVICDHIDSNGNDKHSIDWFCADGKRREENESQT